MTTIIPPDAERMKASAPELLQALEELLRLTFDQYNNDPVFWAAQRAVFRAFPEKFGYYGRSADAEFTTGHCAERAKPNGCQLHNLQCGYPDCDRRLTERQVYDATR